MKIGSVVQADIAQQYIRIHLKVSPEEVFISMPCIIHGDLADYYCIITNIFQKRDDLTLNMSYTNVTRDDGVTNVVSDLDRQEAMEIYADLYCLQIIFRDPRKNPTSFKTIPRRLSETRTATQEDINRIYVEPMLQDRPVQSIDPEVGTEHHFDPHGFAFGFLSSNTNIEIPVRMDKIIERPLEVVGMTGSGKTVTIKNIIFRIIGDPNDCLHTRMIVFDVQNEYIIRKAGRKDPGIYDLFPEKVKIITLDPENCEQMGIHDAERFRVFEENITVDDVLSVLSNTNLSEKMKRTLWHLHTDWIQTPRNTRGTFYDHLMRFYNEPDFAKDFDSEGSSYQALHSRLRTIARNGGVLSSFIEERTRESDRDSIQDIIDLLQSSNPSKKSFIIHFGKYGKTAHVYEFIANILGRRVYKEYSEKNDIVLEGDRPPYDPCVFLLEEAHKFIRKSDSDAPSIFNLIAREMRKYGLTLFIVDQMPSKLDEEIIAQLNNRILHRMSDQNDIRSSLSGLDTRKWGNMISNLGDGESLCFGSMVGYMPTVIKSFYGDPQQFKEFHGIENLARKVLRKEETKVKQLSDFNTNTLTKSRKKPKKKEDRVISPPIIPEDDDFNDDILD